MKHAYLILAHNEFEVLQELVKAIDDTRNDIIIHFDAKVGIRPRLSTTFSKIFLTSERINVHWGDISVVKAELELFKTALRYGEYSYLHLISGVDMPVKSQDFIHNFFIKHSGKEFIGFHQDNASKEITRKVQRWHLFPKSFKDERITIRGLRKAFIKFQELFNIKRNANIKFMKGTQWVSITPSFAKYVLKQKESIEKIYTHTFCPDEIFLQTICWNSEFKKNIHNPSNEGLGCLRAIPWKENKIMEWKEKDIDNILKDDNYMFARKFSYKNMNIVHRILGNIKSGFPLYYTGNNK